jgi:hypothetical protein
MPMMHKDLFKKLFIGVFFSIRSSADILVFAFQIPMQLSSFMSSGQARFAVLRTISAFVISFHSLFWFGFFLTNNENETFD